MGHHHRGSRRRRRRGGRRHGQPGEDQVDDHSQDDQPDEGGRKLPGSRSRRRRGRERNRQCRGLRQHRRDARVQEGAVRGLPGICLAVWQKPLHGRLDRYHHPLRACGSLGRSDLQLLGGWGCGLPSHQRLCCLHGQHQPLGAGRVHRLTGGQLLGSLSGGRQRLPDPQAHGGIQRGIGLLWITHGYS